MSDVVLEFWSGPRPERPDDPPTGKLIMTECISAARFYRLMVREFAYRGLDDAL